MRIRPLSPQSGHEPEHAAMSTYADRSAAGRALAQLLSEYRGRGDVIVLGLPRGGVPVAAEVARALAAELDVLVVRKIGMFGQPELALGAVAGGGTTVFNTELIDLLGEIEPQRLRSHVEHERAEVALRETLFRRDRPALDLKNRTAILIDDGSATGATMLAAVRCARALGAQRIVAALPVAPAEVCDKLEREADEVVCPLTPRFFRSVGEWYVDFTQTENDEVRELLAGGGCNS